jgi:AraC-like DNA-binding protein
VSRDRQLESLAADSLLGEGGGFRRHAHARHQLSWATSGSFSVDAAGATWFVSPHVGIWVPAETEHEVVAQRRSFMRSLYFLPDSCCVRWTTVTAVATSGFAGALLDHLGETDDGPARTRAEQVLFDVLDDVAPVVVRVPTIADDRGRRVADALRAEPSDRRTLEEWARMVGASGRTLARVIERETGMGFAQWRNHIRVAHGARQLVEGKRVSEVAMDSGFSSSSAFVASFRRVVGVTPGRYAAAERERRRHEAPRRSAVTVVEPGALVDPRPRGRQHRHRLAE